LEKALEWATLASGPRFPGDTSSFIALSTKAAILDKLGRGDESVSVTRKALPFGNMGQLQQLGRQMISLKKTKMALEVFEFNYKRNPDNFITLVGMARGLSANGDHAKALEYASKALPLAPNEANKKIIQEMIDKLKESKDIN
jgi:tetratricopeptide (TPR) repeat protein